MADQGHQSRREELALGLLIGGLLLFAGFHAISKQAVNVRYLPVEDKLVGISWRREPETFLGLSLRDYVNRRWKQWAQDQRAGKWRPPRQEFLIHRTADGLLGIFNGLRQHWPIFLILSLCGLAAEGLLARNLSKTPASVKLQMVAASANLTANLLLGAAIPAVVPVPVGVVGIVYCGLQTAVGLLWLLANLLDSPSPKQKLKYGPAFQLPVDSHGRPARRQAGVLLGSVDRDILPQHTRWIADQAGDVVIPFDRISCGVTVLGEKGSGKSRLLFRFHDAIRAWYPRVPIVIHDPKGEWYRTFYDPATDLVFAPHFEGSARWAIWDDFQRLPQLRHEVIATAVYAHDTKGDQFWVDSAIRLLRMVANCASIEAAGVQLNLMWKKNSGDKTWLSTYQFAKLGLEDIAKVALGPAPPGGGSAAMSIDDFLRWPGRIFLLNDPSCATEQKGAFSLFLSAIMLRTLSGPDLPAGELRAVTIVDEALTFHLPTDVDRRIYSLCRSKGLSIIAGAQRLPNRHLHETGEWETAEFTLGMKVISQDTQASLSRRAGQMHFDQPRAGKSESDGRVSKSENDQGERMDAIPPEHFGRLAARQFVLFHDRGIVTGKTTDVEHDQSGAALPLYDQRQDVLDFTRALQ